MKTKIYDLPTRLFHWLFAGLFLGSFFIAKVFEDESAAYPYHMMLGLLMAVAVLLRILWGVFGSRYARFSSFSLNLKELVEYLKSFLLSESKIFAGHNPASSWAAVAMLGLALGLAVTGIAMVQGFYKEIFEEVHELFANIFIIIVILHISGVILHTLRHQDGIGLSMFHGKKAGLGPSEGIQKSHTAVGLLFLFIITVVVFHFNKNYDSSTKSLNLLGTNLQLGDSDDDDRHERRDHEGDDHDDD